MAVLGTHQHRTRLASLCLASLSSTRAPPPHYCDLHLEWAPLSYPRGSWFLPEAELGLRQLDY